jgi:hypothetical protein
MNSKEVELAVVNYFGARKHLIVPNVSWGFTGLYYEADLVVVTRAGYAKEVEIKVSRSDLLKDKEKKHNHDCRKFKELYFAIPKKLVKDIEHIPDRAGILVCEKVEYKGEYYYRAHLERNAKVNGGVKLTLADKYELARLGTLRIWNLKKKLIQDRLKN